MVLFKFDVVRAKIIVHVTGIVREVIVNFELNPISQMHKHEDL